MSICPGFCAGGQPDPDPAPTTTFTAAPTTGTAPLDVTVVATVDGATAWAWNFGDGGTASGRTPPVHTYALPGPYTITLTASNANGQVVRTQGITVTSTAPVPPVAAFTATPMTGIAPLNVTVTDNSGGAPTSWAWEFGDGQTSNLQNPPAHTYASPGTYTVTLIAANSAGTSAPVQNQIVVGNACPSPVANFTFDQQNKNKPVDFVGSLTPITCPVTQAGTSVMAARWRPARSSRMPTPRRERPTRSRSRSLPHLETS